ncbi:hypothetical protein BDN72DRAFT_195551 [Pluteus cervinus]|uniref:Uncharacterized protein n=1 Tax=Pluteus cervinus TaxID=181527 RepID=A0ACD3AIV4_9AGAR|nr:hypothetical protein BDN72DRAFT_195551 [Pluteus cervinus]
MMPLDDPKTASDSTDSTNKQVPAPQSTSPLQPHELKWDWGVEHEDRKREAKADHGFHNSTPFQVDRRVLKDVVLEKMGVDVARITFLSSGTFHKAYLVTLIDGAELVARVARRFMPRLKTESEVATMQYLRENTDVPVPVVYHYDANPYNRLGGEYILMSKASGIPLSKVFHSLSYTELVKFTNNLAAFLIPLFAHRFDAIGSLYAGPTGRKPDASAAITPSVLTPKAAEPPLSSFPFTKPLSFSSLLLPLGHEPVNSAASTLSSGGATPVPPSLTRNNTVLSNSTPTPKSLAKFTDGGDQKYHVGPIISWPFFGSNRGELSHPTEINRGPWPSTHAYFEACAEREITGVILENEGKSAPHRLHLDPDEILSSRHHHLNAVPGDESDDSDEYDLEESEEEWEGPGDAMYRDYRRMQRSTFLVAHMKVREDTVKKETARWKDVMERLVSIGLQDSGGGGTVAENGVGGWPQEEFSLDCHDLSLENVFVDAKDHTKITCVIDWESTTTRPLWQCTHLPPCLQASPFTANLFRKAVIDIASGAFSPVLPPKHVSSSATIKPVPLQELAKQWLYYESVGTRLRMCHRFAEWDGWEEGLVDSILGPEEHEDEWFKNLVSRKGVPEDHDMSVPTSPPVEGLASPVRSLGSVVPGTLVLNGTTAAPASNGVNASSGATNGVNGSKVNGRGASVVVDLRKLTTSKLPFDKEKEKEQVLSGTGDICGGRGGELGRRLEAWLTVTGQVDGHGGSNVGIAASQ